MSFTQELPKYLRGFHKCSQEDAIHLAGLIYKAQFADDRSQLASIPKILRELVPENFTRLMSSEEWKKVLGKGWGGGPGLLPRQRPPPQVGQGGRTGSAVAPRPTPPMALGTSRCCSGLGPRSLPWRDWWGTGLHSGPHWPSPPPEHPPGL